MTIRTCFLIATVLTVSFVFAGWAFAQNTPDTAASAFFEHIKERRFEDASALLTDNLQTYFSRPTLREFIIRCESQNISVTNERIAAGGLQNVDPPQRKDLPGGVIWESVLRFKNAALPVRVAIDEQNKIAAIEFYRSSEGPTPTQMPRCIGNTALFAKAFGHDYTLLVEVLTPDGQPCQVDQYASRSFGLYRKVYAIPEDNRNSSWTDPEDGTHWIMHPSPADYADRTEARWQNNVLRMSALEKGTYRVAITLVNPRPSELPRGNIFTPPVTLDETNKEQKITAQMVRGGTIRIRIVDAETGEPIEKAWAGATNTSVPVSSTQVIRNKIDDVHVHEFVFPGRYVITLHCPVNQADDLVYTPEEEYEVMIADGDDYVEFLIM
ncbi:MAG: hypothetical protein FWE67_13830 [Planctomycetaceae bacterium]|nr:hypothetical protein [Planctomycetaceae bacterium]